MHTREGLVPWPEDLVRTYRELGYWDGLSLDRRVSESGARRPQGTALVDGQIRMSYEELDERVSGAAGRLVRLGIKTDDRILIQLPGCWQFVVLTLACFRAGAIPVMALASHREHELSHLAEHSEALAIALPDVVKSFDHQEMAEALLTRVDSLRLVLVSGDAHPGNVDLGELLAPGDNDEVPESPGELALFLLSGGTTGLPKLIARTHDDYSYCTRMMADVAGITVDTVYLVSLPPSHNFPLTGILGTLFAGGTVVMLQSPEPSKAFAAIQREGVTHTAVVPAVAQRWIEYAQVDPSATIPSLQVLQVGGSRLADEVARKVQPVLGARLQQVFGMAEGLVCMTRLDDSDEVICTTQGRPVSDGDDVMVLDEAESPAPDGTAGSLVTRGPYTPRGYYRAPEHNTRAFTPDGWYRSGDIVERRLDGNVVVMGRDKDMINRAGEKISAEEVESLVYRIESVEMVAAVSMPDQALGERLCLYVVLRPGHALTLQQVRQSMEGIGVAAFKLPDRLVVVNELPTTKVGKIDKKRLREDIAARLDELDEASLR